MTKILVELILQFIKIFKLIKQVHVNLVVMYTRRHRVSSDIKEEKEKKKQYITKKERRRKCS